MAETQAESDTQGGSSSSSSSSSPPSSSSSSSSSPSVTRPCPVPSRPVAASGRTLTDPRRKEEEGYARLQRLLPEIGPDTQIPQVDIVEGAVSHIQQLTQRVWNTLSSQEDAEKAKAFLQQRISQGFQICPSSQAQRDCLVCQNDDEPRCHTASIPVDQSLTSSPGSESNLQEL